MSLEKDVDGIVLAVQLSVDGTSYQVQWWSGRDVKREWFPAPFVIPSGPTTLQRIGFTS